MVNEGGEEVGDEEVDEEEDVEEGDEEVAEEDEEPARHAQKRAKKKAKKAAQKARRRGRPGSTPGGASEEKAIAPAVNAARAEEATHDAGCESKEALKTKGIRAFEEMMEERATEKGASRRAINERVAKKMGFHVQAYDAERDAQMRAVAKEEVRLLVTKWEKRNVNPEAIADEEHNAYMRAVATEEGRLVASLVYTRATPYHQMILAAPRASASGGGSAYLEWLLSPEARAAETNTARAEEAARDEYRGYRGHVQTWEDVEEMEDYYEMDEATFEREYGGGG